VFPLFLSSPAVLDIVGGAPQIAAHFLAPQPWLMLAPLANAEHNRPAAGIKRGPDIGVRGFRTLVIQRVAPVILQIIDAPRRVHERILVLVPKAARTTLTGFRSGIGIDSKLQAQRMYIIRNRFYSMRKMRIDNNICLRVARLLPAIID